MPRSGKWIVTSKTIDMETMETVSEKGYWYDGPVDRCDPATIMLVATLVSAGFGVGTTAYGLANKPGTPKMPTTPAVPTQAQMNQTQAAQRAATAQQLPNIQASTSGFTNPGYQAMMAQLLGGTAGQPGSQSSANKAVMNAFGLGGNAPGTPTQWNPSGSGNTLVPGAPTNLSDFTNQFFSRG